MKIFVSYSHNDKIVCQLIVDRLRVRHDVWYDEHLLGGVAWAKELDKQVMESEGLIFLMSEASLNSEACAKEVDLALSLNKIIFPVKLSNRIDPPDKLKHIQYINFGNGLGNFEELIHAIYIAEIALLRGNQ